MAARTSEDRALQAWDVADVEFDANGTFEEKALALLRFAVLAPSGHNTQPWRFLIGQGSVDFFADRARRLEVVDPSNRELVMSVGAAIGISASPLTTSGRRLLSQPFHYPMTPTSSRPFDCSRPLHTTTICSRRSPRGEQPVRHLTSAICPTNSFEN
jgi:hypothetical protein